MAASSRAADLALRVIAEGFSYGEEQSSFVKLPIKILNMILKPIEEMLPWPTLQPVSSGSGKHRRFSTALTN